MPQGLAFAIPFETPVGTVADHARAQHVKWVQQQQLVRSEAGLLEYLSWDLPQAAARTYPYAQGDDMTMLMNWFSLAFLFDDQFDATVSDHADQVAQVSRELITIPFRPRGTPPDHSCPVTVAWSEVWAWLSDGMSDTWCDRFASSWARFLAAHTSEVRLSAAGVELGYAEFLDLRRRTVGIHHSIDAAERTRNFEVPAQVQAHDLMRRMRAAAADTIAFMNDIHSLEREERRGDGHNLVTILRKHRNCSRQEAINAAVAMTDEHLALYLRLEARIPELCLELGLGPEERRATEMGVEAIRHWIRGNYDWARNTGRYAAEKTGVAARAESMGRGSVDDLLHPVLPEQATAARATAV